MLIRRLLLVPLDDADPHRLLVDCARMRRDGDIWRDVGGADWRGVQGRVLLDLPPMTADRWAYWLGSPVAMLWRVMAGLGSVMREWRVVAIDEDGREVGE